MIEGFAPGGQAGTSSRIENYLGFPTGIGGQQLASRAQLQALKFGVQFAISRETVTIEPVNGIHKLTLAGGIPVSARAVVVATGAQYRKLAVKNYEQYENCGLFYAATPMESILCRDKDVIVVGGGNSAGQAAVFLSVSPGMFTTWSAGHRWPRRCRSIWCRESRAPRASRSAQTARLFRWRASRPCSQ